MAAATVTRARCPHRDAGYRCQNWLALIALWSIVMAATAGTALAKTYSAERFDSVIRILSGGDIEVTETVVFRFETGTFSHVYRDIPTRRTDGIDVRRASMDGVPFPFGSGTGQVDVSRRSRVRVRWRFEPVSSSAHTFVLTYVARGVIHQRDDSDLLWWRALPSEHDYSIASSRLLVEYPGERASQPHVDGHRVANTNVERQADALRVMAVGIRRNGWIELRVPFRSGSLIAHPPAWQQRQIRQAQMAPRWQIGAAMVFLGGLILLFAVRQQYDAPPREMAVSGPVHDPPADLSPAVAGALASNGSVSLPHAMAALLALAERGEIAIAEGPRGVFGQHHFTVHRLRTGEPLSRLETALIDMVFSGEDREGDSISLARARSRISSRMRHLTMEIGRELAARGLLDEDRRRIRDRYGRLALAMLLVATAGFIAAALLVRGAGPWPLLLPGALVVVAIIGFIVRGSTTPLSNEGIRLARQWRAFREHLKEVAQSRVHLSADTASDLLPVAVALGLASAWSKFLKQQPVGVPPWFQTLSSADDGGFAALVAVGAADSSSGVGGVGAGAAGGGGSGAG